jgi:hypothetical protein
MDLNFVATNQHTSHHDGSTSRGGVPPTAAVPHATCCASHRQMRLLAKDNKEVYTKTVMKEFFDFVCLVGKSGIPESTMEPSLPRFIVLSSQYLSSLWKSLGVGVSSSHTNHFCVWFTCHRDCRGIGCVAK